MESLLFSSSLSHPSLSTGEGISRGQANFKNKMNACSSIAGSGTLNIHRKHCANYHLNSLGQRFALIHCRKKKTHLARAALQSPSGSEPKAYNPDSTRNSLKDGLIAFCQLIRLYVVTGTVISVISVSFLTVERLSDLNPVFFTGLLQAVIPAALMMVFVGGVNQLTDIEIDKVNKPHLPLASGKLSSGTAIVITAFLLIMSSCLGIIVGSKPLLSAIFSGFVYGIGYSIKLPLLRWKNSAATAAISISTYHGLAVPILYFFHMQTHVLRRPAHFPRSLVFTAAFMSVFCIVIALYKDIPDIDGDKKHGVRSLATHLGQKRVFWICISILLMEYAGAVLVGSLSSNILSKVITISGHVILASILWARAKSVDLKSEDALKCFYMFLWKVYYAEYLLIPFVR